MAFSTSEKEKICFYLGYPPTPDNLSKIQQRMDELTEVGENYVTRAQQHITELDQLQGEIEVERASSGGAFTQLKGEARRYASLLAIALNLPKNNDVYSA
ncbi:MAG: hypothetical protein WBA57_21265 [Elainellaceae cyanobacterium]